MANWLLKLKDGRSVPVTAEVCETDRNGALIIKGGNNFYTKAIIAPGEWVMVELEANPVETGEGYSIIDLEDNY